MLRYVAGMVFQSRFVLSVLLLSFAVLSGCGDESGTALDGFAASESQLAGVGITGNVANLPDSQSVLVFAFLRSGENPNEEPVSVGIVGAEGEFTLSGLPGGRIGLTFLADGANDGVIDPGDPIAHLIDPDQQLEDLRDSDRAHLLDIQLDFGAKRAVADVIEISGAGDSPVPATPTPNE